MCSQSDDPSQHDVPRRPACERRIWVRGVDRPCGAEMGVTSWTDANGRTHTACRHHIVEVRYRYPEPVPA